MNKPKLFIYVAAGILLIVAIMTLPFQVGSVLGENAEQTWPSRTPTPQGGPQPTATNEPPPQPTDDPGGGPPQDTATPEPQPDSTPGSEQPTPTTVVTIELVTPEGGYNATAEPCDVPPTVQARGLVNVREGPGLDYEPIASLIFLEVRPIIGRAEFATWWLIQLPGNETGWVADQAVAVQGYTGLVPILESPDLNGATPTPGPLWEPTPNPVCTPLPTPTATAEPTIEAAEPTTLAVSNTTPTEAPPEPTDTPTEESTEAAPTDTPEPEPEGTATTTGPTPTTDTGSPITEGPGPENSSDSAASASSWILFIGIGLVVVGAASWFFRNRG